MEGGGNMKREGEGHREIERVSEERERRGERLVSRIENEREKDRRKGKVRMCPMFFLFPWSERRGGKEREKMG